MFNGITLVNAYLTNASDWPQYIWLKATIVDTGAGGLSSRTMYQLTAEEVITKYDYISAFTGITKLELNSDGYFNV